MPIRISNTLTGRKEPFEPMGVPVKLYVCGMTPKFHPHVGHARLFVCMDVIRRWLEHRGYPVRHIQNFTDVDDKIIARAQVEGKTPAEVAQEYSDSYFAAMDALGVRRATAYPTVTAFMPQIIAFVQGLIERGYAYVSDGDVWYAVERFPEYGKLSGRTTEEGQLVGARKELEPGKRDPRDFALWKAAKPGEPAWESPWGPGRPGWHIECSTMVRETLGDQIDIHGGGADLIFPHHENEIAQSEALTGKRPFARYWVHVGLVTTAGEKMSHSLLNFATVEEVVREFGSAAVRHFLLSTHYRAPIAYSREALVASARAVERLRTALEGYDGSAAAAEWTGGYEAAFGAALDDDFNTAQALAALFDLAREINRRRAGGADARAGQALLARLAGLLGMDLTAAGAARHEAAEPYIELLVAVRQQLRERRVWDLADRIRDDLRALGIALEDRPDRTVWRRVAPGE